MLHGICRGGNGPRGYEIRVNLEVIPLPTQVGPKTEAPGK